MATKTPRITGQTYTSLKYLSLVLLPAFATLYAGLAAVWHFPHVHDVVLSITAIDTFIGTSLGLTSAGRSNANKIDGEIHVEEPAGTAKKKFTMELDSDPNDIENKKTVTFQVRKHPSPR